MAAAASILVVAGVAILLSGGRQEEYKGGQMPPIAMPDPFATLASPPGADRMLEDFSWLTRSIVSNTRSAARALTPRDGETPTLDEAPSRSPGRGDESRSRLRGYGASV